MRTVVSIDGGKDRGRNVLRAVVEESQFVQYFASEALEMTNKLH